MDVEGLSVTPLGEVQIAVDLAADADGDSEQRPQTRMAGREADGGRMGRDVVEPQGFGVADQVAEDAQTARQLGARQVVEFPLGQPGGDELVQALTGRVEDAQRAVAGADQVHGGGHDAVQHRGQLHLPADGHHRAQQALHPVHGVQQGAQLLVDPAQLGTQAHLQVGQLRLPGMLPWPLTCHHERLVA